MSSEEQPKRTAEPVGQQLRRARERAGLDLSAIADQQHLRTSVIQAIEDGDYGKVDTELFLKGYVRAYAQHVGLEPDAIIQDLDAELEPLREERERQHEADPLVDIERRKRRKQRVARAVVVLLVLAGIGLAVFVYLADGSRKLPGFGADQPPETSENMPQAEEGGSEPGVLDTQPGVVEPEAPDTGLPESPEADAPGVDDSELTVSPVVVEGGSTASQNPQNAPAEEPEVIEPEMPEVASSEPEPEPDVVTESAPAAEEVATTSTELRMSFNDDCWVQVTDAQGNRLASTLRTSGDVLEVSGEAPLSVVIGAMSALDSLEFEGEPVDLNTIRAVNDRAQFTLEP